MARSVRHFIVLIAGLLLLSATLPALAQASGYIVNASRVNLRTGPGAGYPIVTVLTTGQQFTLLSRNADGTTGWVHSGFIFTSFPIANLQLRG